MSTFDSTVQSKYAMSSLDSTVHVKKKDENFELGVCPWDDPLEHVLDGYGHVCRCDWDHPSLRALVDVDSLGGLKRWIDSLVSTCHPRRMPMPLFKDTQQDISTTKFHALYFVARFMSYLWRARSASYSQCMGDPRQ